MFFNCQILNNLFCKEFMNVGCYTHAELNHIFFLLINFVHFNFPSGIIQKQLIYTYLLKSRQKYVVLKFSILCILFNTSYTYFTISFQCFFLTFCCSLILSLYNLHTCSSANLLPKISSPSTIVSKKLYRRPFFL